jgi:hypothetical protein
MHERSEPGVEIEVRTLAVQDAPATIQLADHIMAVDHDRQTAPAGSHKTGEQKSNQKKGRCAVP